MHKKLPALCLSWLLLFFPGPIFSQEPIAAAEASTGVALTNVLENIKSSQRDFKRKLVRKTEELDIVNYMHLESTEITDINFEQKVIHTVKQIKDFNLKMGDMQRAISEEKLRQAQAHGLPEEKMQQLKDAIGQAEKQLQEMTQKIAEKIKAAKNEIFYIDNAIYIYQQNKWFKIEAPFMSAIWDFPSQLKGEGSAKVEVTRAINKLPADSAKAISGIIFSYLGNYDEENYFDKGSIAQADFEGQPCYKIDVKPQAGGELLKKSLHEYSQMNGNGNSDINVDYFKGSEFFSPENFLSLGSLIDSQLSFFNLQANQKMLAKIHEKWDCAYPQGQIELPLELALSTPLKDMREMDTIIQQEAQDLMKP